MKLTWFREKFECPECKSMLASNINHLIITAVIIVTFITTPLIWYFIEGVNFRTNDYPFENKEKYKKWIIRLTKEYEDTDMMNNRKNYGFYVSFNENRFQCPDDLIKKEDVEKIKNKAWTRIYFGSKIISAMIPNFPKIKAQAKKLDYSKMNKEIRDKNLN